MTEQDQMSLEALKRLKNRGLNKVDPSITPESLTGVDMSQYSPDDVDLLEGQPSIGNSKFTKPNISAPIPTDPTQLRGVRDVGPKQVGEIRGDLTPVYTDQPDTSVEDADIKNAREEYEDFGKQPRTSFISRPKVKKEFNVIKGLKGQPSAPEQFDMQQLASLPGEDVPYDRRDLAMTEKGSPDKDSDMSDAELARYNKLRMMLKGRM